MERRGSGRLGINVETSISTKDGYFTAILQNISVGGLFLWTNKHIEMGEMIGIHIPLPDSPDKNNVTVNAIAVRIMDNGVAFKYKVIDDNTQSALLYLSNSAHV